MICAVLIPSRARPDRLHKTMRSIFDTVSELSDIDVMLRFDDDDVATMSRAEEFRAYPRTTILTGPRKRGYSSLNEFYTNLADASKASWVWIMNDDAHITGEGWDRQLHSIPTTGYIVQPELYQLGLSKYFHCEGGAFPLAPNGCWRTVASRDMIQNPADTWFDVVLRKTAGWKTHFLNDIAVVHERDKTEELELHRRFI